MLNYIFFVTHLNGLFSGELRNVLTSVLGNRLTEMTVQTDLGCHVYIQGHIPDTRRVFVDVDGDGKHVDMSIDEALQVCDHQEVALNHEINLLNQNIATLTAQLSGTEQEKSVASI